MTKLILSLISILKRCIAPGDQTSYLYLFIGLLIGSFYWLDQPLYLRFFASFLYALLVVSGWAMGGWIFLKIRYKKVTELSNIAPDDEFFNVVKEYGDRRVIVGMSKTKVFYVYKARRGEK